MKVTLLVYRTRLPITKMTFLKRVWEKKVKKLQFAFNWCTFFKNLDLKKNFLGCFISFFIFFLLDDDSVIIGSWFEEPATPGEEGANIGEGGSSSSTSSTSSIANSQTKTPHRQNSEVTTLVPEKGEPHGVSFHFLVLKFYESYD